MILFEAPDTALFRYDNPSVSALILSGSVRVTTLNSCRNAENLAARDSGEGSRTITSEPGRHSLNSTSAAQLLGVPVGSIAVTGPNAFVTVGDAAVVRIETVSDAFVLCLSTRGNDSDLKARFGHGCVRINDPQSFIELVDRALRERVAPLALNDCHVADVNYRPRTTTFREIPDKPSYFIKPAGGAARFEIEQEVRAVWTLTRTAAIEPIQLQIPEVATFLALS